jgi:hypothetical protein
VVVGAQAQGGTQTRGQRELVLHEQRLVRHVVTATGGRQAGIDQLFLAPLAAKAIWWLPRRRRDVAVHHVVGHVLRARRRHAIAAAVDHAHLAAVGAQLGLGIAKPARPADMGLAPIQVVAVDIGAAAVFTPSYRRRSLPSLMPACRRWLAVRSNSAFTPRLRGLRPSISL